MSIRIVNRKMFVPIAPEDVYDRLDDVEAEVSAIKSAASPVATVEVALRWGSLTIPGGTQARGVLTVTNASSEPYLWMPVARIWNAFSQSNGGATITPTVPANTAAYTQLFGYVYFSPTLNEEEPAHPSWWWNYGWQRTHFAVNWVYFDDKVYAYPEEMSAYIREPGGILLAPGQTRKFNIFQFPQGMTTSDVFQPVHQAFTSPRTAVAKTIASKGAPAAGWDDNALILTFVKPLQLTISFNPGEAHAVWV